MTEAYPARVIKRFWSKVEINGLNNCWLWKGARLYNGYGTFSLTHTKQVRAHRFAVEVSSGPIPPGECILHDCDNPPCCNPRHLWTGTDLDNIADRDAKGRQAKGERISTSKLTPPQVREIRRDPREQRDIAADYQVCKSTVGNIKRGDNWGWLK